MLWMCTNNFTALKLNQHTALSGNVNNRYVILVHLCRRRVRKEKKNTNLFAYE